METIKLSELTNFTTKQKHADKESLKYKYFLYGGAMGGGKSYWLRWKLVKVLIRWAKEGHTDVEVGLFCEDYPTLKDRQISKIAKEFPSWLGTFHADHKEHGKCYILSPEYGSGIIKFRNLDDPSKYQSAEFAAIAVDEITKNQFETFEDLRNRLRWTGIEDVHFYAGTNPGGIGHAWVKKYFIDKDYPDEETEADQFGYVQALAQDNPHLAQTYIAQLESLSPEKRRAFLEGDWDIFKGQFFTEWRKNLHVVKPFVIPDEWKLILWLDYGYAKPSAVQWVAISPDKQKYIYREIYSAGFTYKELMEEIISMTPDNELLRLYEMVADPAIWQKKGENDTGLSGYQIMTGVWKNQMKEKNINRPTEMGHFPSQILIKRGNNSRIIGWDRMRQALKSYLGVDGEPTAELQVFETCKNYITTIPSLIYDKHVAEDLDSDGEDHHADATRYGLMDNPQPNITNRQKEDILFRRAMKKKKGQLHGSKQIFRK